MTFQAVLFDLDGTLLNTLDDLANSMNQVLKSLGLPIHETDDYKDFVGEGVEFLVTSALPENHRNKEAVSQAIAAMREEYRKQMLVKSRPYPEIPQLLNALTKQKIKMAVLSNKPHGFTQIMVQKLLPDCHFECILGSQNYIPKKPDPKSALLIAEHLKLKPCNMIYLGDTRIDMMTAQAARMYPVGALWGFRSREELLGSGAKAVIKNPMILLDLIY